MPAAAKKPDDRRQERRFQSKQSTAMTSSPAGTGGGLGRRRGRGDGKRAVGTVRRSSTGRRYSDAIGRARRGRDRDDLSPVVLRGGRQRRPCRAPVQGDLDVQR